MTKRLIIFSMKGSNGFNVMIALATTDAISYKR